MLVTEITIFYRIKANVYLSGETGRRKLLLVFISTDEITAVDGLQKWPQWSLVKFLSHIIPELIFVTKRTWQRVCDFQDQIIEDMRPLYWWCCPWLREAFSPVGKGEAHRARYWVPQAASCEYFWVNPATPSLTPTSWLWPWEIWASTELRCSWFLTLLCVVLSS